jgi:hypothetical protein
LDPSLDREDLSFERWAQSLFPMDLREDRWVLSVFAACLWVEREALSFERLRLLPNPKVQSFDRP